IIYARKGGKNYFKDAEEFVWALKPGHHRNNTFMQCIDYPTASLPLRGAVYSVSTGQNLTGKWFMKRLRTVVKNIPWRMQLLTADLPAQFPVVELTPLSDFAPTV